MADYRWRLSDLLDRRHLSIRAFGKALDDQGMHRSRSQLNRLLTQPTISFEMYAAICRAVECTPSDLLEWRLEILHAAGAIRKRPKPPRFRLP